MPLNALNFMFGQFSSITLAEQDIIRNNTFIRNFDKGKFVFEAGEVSTYLMCRLTGMVKICRSVGGDRESILTLVKPYGLVGYQSLLSNKPHLSYAKAITNASFVCVPRHIILNILESNAKFAVDILRYIIDVQNYQESTIATHSQSFTRVRLAYTLKHLYDTFGVDPTYGHMTALLPRTDLGNLACMSRENAIRTLFSFQEEGILKSNSRRITILDYNKLELVSLSVE